MTATVEDAAGNPTPGITVRFAVTGSVTTSGTDTTDANGEATLCYQGPNCRARTRSPPSPTPTTTAPRTPVSPPVRPPRPGTLPVTTPLCQATITDGGRITANNGDRATFGGNANDAAGRQGPAAVSGPWARHTTERELDRNPGPRCNQQRTQARSSARATIGGQGSHLFRIDVQDLAEPGSARTPTGSSCSNGYDSGSTPLRAATSRSTSPDRRGSGRAPSSGTRASRAGLERPSRSEPVLAN